MPQRSDLLFVHSCMRLCEIIGSPLINTETDFFIQCPCCTTWLDCRDLGDLLAHEDWCSQDQNNSPMPGRGPQ